MLSRSAATSNSILFRLTLMGLAIVATLVATSVFAASAKGAVRTFTSINCGGPPQGGVATVPVGQIANCLIRVSSEGTPSASGLVTLTDSRGTGEFIGGNSCELRSEGPFVSTCEKGFRSATAGGRTITAKYAGDGANDPSEFGQVVKVFIPNSTRFAAPGGTGADPCITKATPCSLFTAASFQAPDTSIVAGATVVLAPGTYNKADLGNRAELSPEAGITFRGEAGAARPLIVTENGFFTSNTNISHVEIESKGILGISARGSVIDEIVARTSAAGSVACSIESGTLRDSACISTGAGGVGAGTFLFIENGEIFQPRFRNVTAVGTGPESVGMRFQNETGREPGELNADLGSVIADGTKVDVQAKSVGAPAGQVRVTLDHSNYATIEPKDPTATISITLPGDVSHANITAPPLLAADNIHQTFSSPTIDKGLPDGLSGTIDVDGEVRKQGLQVDIGADEITPPNSTETKLTCKSTTPFSGEATKCTATVTDKADNSPARPLDGGTVTFKDNTQPAGSLTPTTCTLEAISSTQASCKTEVEFKSTTLGNHALEASFATDGKGHTGSVGALGVEVKARPNDTDTKLSCKVGTLFSGETTKCTVTVTDKANNGPASPLAGGTVTFKDNTEPAAFTAPATCALVEVTTTTATCQTELDFKPTTVANHALEASYPGDAGKHSASTGTLSVQVKQPPNSTETKLTCKVASLITGESTKCTATVTDKADKGAAKSLAGGTVTFKDNTQASAFTPPATCTLTALTATTATCQTEVDFKPTTVANHALEASLTADEAHLASTGTLSFEVKAKPNTTETKISCKATTLISGETTKCTATVADNADNNPASTLAGVNVTFKDNTEGSAFAPPATCTLVQVTATSATCQTEVDFKPTAVANHVLEASYPGDNGKHAPSVSAPLTFQVRAQAAPNGTETKLECKATSMFSGETTKCNATVTDKANNGPPASMAGGLVTFKDNTETAAFPQPASCQLVTINATQAGCQVEVDFKPTTVANHALEAAFPGDGAHTGSTGLLTVQVKAQPNDTETKLSCKASPLISGETTQCTVTVTDKANRNPASPLGGGAVTFKDNTQESAFKQTTCTLAVLTSTTATCQVEVEFNPTVVGNHALEAKFAGDNAHASSVGVLTVQVRNQPNTTETKLSCKADSLITGQSTQCTATVTDKADNGAPTPPTGTVTFKDNTQAGTFTPASCQLQTTGANVASCQAEVELKPTQVANHQLEASFPADGAHVASVGLLSFQVKSKPNDTETKISCKADTLISGGSTTCTATVTDNANNNPASSLAGGVVTFKDNTQANAFVAPGTCTLATISATQARCQTEVELKPTTVGGHALEASYPGDGGPHAASVGATTVQVNAQANDTETELTCKATTLLTGESTKCTVTVTDIANNSPASPPAGVLVSFDDEAEDGSFAPATCMLVARGASRATCQVEVDFKPTVAGEHLLTASYPGDGGAHAASAGTLDADVEGVQQPPVLRPTKTTLVCAPASIVLGAGASQCTATVEDSGVGATHPGGKVKLEIVSGEGTLAANSCDLPADGQLKVSCQVVAYTPGKAGDHELKATYQGDLTHEQSSGTTKLTVTAPPPPPPPPAAPNTTLGKKPAKRTAAKLATFRFSSDQAGATFLCKVDRKAFKACKSPFKVKVKNGAHTFTVKAVNAQGVADPTPVVYKWTVGPVKQRPRR